MATNDIVGFQKNPGFYDNKSFPHGFGRSGVFTINETNVLEQYGYTLRDLSTGELDPVTVQEQQFVAVCKGEREADSLIEKVWLKYITHINKKDPNVSPFGSTPKKHTLPTGTTEESQEYGIAGGDDE